MSRIQALEPQRISDRGKGRETSGRYAGEANRDAWAHGRRAMERARVWRSPAGRRPDWRAFLVWRIAQVIFGACVRLIGLNRRGIENALDARLVDLELSWKHLPLAFDGYRILHISDTHFDTLPELAERAKGLLVGVDVDLVVLTGDFRGGIEGPFDRALAPIKPILEVVTNRDGCLAVLGDHDPADIVPALEECKIRVLVNESVALERSDGRIFVTGLDDVHRFYTESARQALLDTAADFKIALVHSPEAADFAAEAGYALYLCGHTHGGQICFPGGRPIVSLLTRCRFASAGLWRIRDMVGYTSRGLGVVKPPVRFNCRGEVTIITLRSA